MAYEYGARGDLPPVKLTWYQGEDKPEIWKSGGIPQWKDGCLFIGEKGMLLGNYTKIALLPEKQFADAKLPAPTLPRSPEHHKQWIEACKGNLPTNANFDYAGWLTEANHLGNVAYRVGRKIHWDAASMRGAGCSGRRPVHSPGEAKGMGTVKLTWHGRPAHAVAD